MVTGPEGVRFRLCVAVVVIVGGAAWVVLSILQNGGRTLPDTSWWAVFVYVALAIGVFLVGRPVRRLLAGRARREVNPIFAARVLAMAQAAALAGSALAGWYLAQLVLRLPDADILSNQRQILVLAVLAVAAGGLAGVGLLVQSWCRLDDDQRPGSETGAATS